MGYTHYWEFGAFVGEKEYKQALSEIRKLIKASPVPLANRMGTPGTKPALGATVSFNGVGPEDDYETFILRADPILETVREDRYPRETLNRKYFCKTAYKPYDGVVVACLCVLQERLGKGVEVSSDGDAGDWEEGRSFAEQVLGRPIKVPAGVGTVEQRNARMEEYKRKLASGENN